MDTRRRGIGCIALVLLFVVVAICGLMTACDSVSGSIKTYYYVKSDGTLDQEDYIKIGGGKWEAPDGTGGPAKKSGDTLSLYLSFSSIAEELGEEFEDELYLEGTLKGGVFTYEERGRTCRYALPDADLSGLFTSAAPAGDGKGGVTLSFNTAGGEALAPITAPAGESIEISTPQRDGYRFVGWYLSAD